MRKIWIAAVSLVILAGLPLSSGCKSEKPAEVPKQEIVIGILDDLSGPGAGAVNEFFAGEKDAMRYINEEKGGISGHPIGATVIDFKMDGTLALTGWERLRDEGVPLVLSVQAGVVPVITNAAEEDRVPIFTGGGTFDQLYPTGPSYFFSTIPNHYGPFQALCDMIEKDWNKRNEKRAPKIGFNIISLGNYKSIFTKAAKMATTEKGWEYIITYSPLGAADTTTEVLQLKNAGVDYLDLHTVDSVDVVVLKDLERQNFHPSIYGYNYLGAQSIWDAVGELAVGARFFQYGVTWGETNIPGVKLIHELNAKWYPEVTSRPSNYVRGFANMMVVAKGLQIAVDSVGYEKLDREAMKTALESIKDYDPLEMGMGYSYSASDRAGLNGCRFYEWTKDGGQKPISDWYKFKPLPPEQRTNKYWLYD